MEDEVRWINLVKKDNEILYISYRDFASIKVESSIKDGKETFDVTVDVFMVTNLTVSVNLKKSCDDLVCLLKRRCEDLYSRISEFDEEDLEKWIKHFIDELQRF